MLSSKFTLTFVVLLLFEKSFFATEIIANFIVLFPLVFN